MDKSKKILVGSEAAKKWNEYRMELLEVEDCNGCHVNFAKEMKMVFCIE